jgi:hypothetical protein
LWPKEYSAAGSSRAEVRVRDGILTVRGRILDRIQWVSGPFVQNDFGKHKIFHATIFAIKAAVSRQTTLASGERFDISKAFRETLVTSRLLERERGGGWTPRILDSNTVERMWTTWSRSLQKGNYHSLDSEQKVLAKGFEDAVYSALYGRAFFVSQQGYLGVVDRAAQVGDAIAVALGGEVLFALHETDRVLDPESAQAEETATNNNLHCHIIGEW